MRKIFYGIAGVIGGILVGIIINQYWPVFPNIFLLLVPGAIFGILAIAISEKFSPSHINEPRRLILPIVLCSIIAISYGYYYASSLYPQEKNLRSYIDTLEGLNDIQEIDTSNWKTFRSETESFSLKYPNNWTIDNSSNTNGCANSTDKSKCRDRYDFISPDGIRVRYVYYTNENTDKLGCGVQSPCQGNKVLDLEKINIPPLEEVYLVKQEKEIYLHEPFSREAIPQKGGNTHDYFDVDFSLPSKIGGRFKLFITTSFAGEEPKMFKKINSSQFYNLQSVKQAMFVLKSLTYDRIQTSDWKTYHNKKWGFEIKYPDFYYPKENDYINVGNIIFKPNDSKYKEVQIRTFPNAEDVQAEIDGEIDYLDKTRTSIDENYRIFGNVLETHRSYANGEENLNYIVFSNKKKFSFAMDGKITERDKELLKEISGSFRTTQ